MNTIVQRLIALGLNTPLAVKLELLVSKWASASGPEWTVRRLKALKIELINHIAGRDRRATWVRRNRDGFPSGPISELFRMAERSKKGRLIAINSLMVYSSFVAESVTKSQREKFFGSMESTDETGLTVVPTRTYKIGKIRHIPTAEPWVNSSLSGESFQPGPDGKSYPETDTFISFVGALASTTIGDIVNRYPLLFNEVMPLRVFYDMRREGTAALKYAVNPISLCVGKISYIQEPGFKLRAVANPNRILQAVLEPLKKVLRKVLEYLPNDYTFDQDAGVDWVQKQLLSSKTIHSIDLSDATNLFPLNYTTSVLLNRVRIDDAEYKERYRSLVGIFNDVSRAPWFSKDPEINVHKFTRGQPLGLGPSFFAFAIAHNVLLMDICRDIGFRNPEEFPFAILGDDIVIADDLLACEYKKALERLGCQISIDKSLESNRVAEFAGKIILVNEIIPQFKWRELTDANVIDFCRNIGRSSVKLLSPKQRYLIDYLSEVPDFLGGLGWNPIGLPLDVRLEDPLVSYLMQKELAVCLPYRRVDVAVLAFVRDPRLLELTPQNTNLDSDVYAVIPARGWSMPRWGTKRFWRTYSVAQERATLLPEYVNILDYGHERNAATIALLTSKVPFEDVYRPFSKDIGDPRKREEVPWFDIIRYFERIQSRLVRTQLSA